MKVLPLPLLLILSSVYLTGCQNIVASSPENTKASVYNIQLGLAYLEQGNRQRAQQKLLTAMAQAPTSPTANEALAYYFEQVQETQQADTYYQRAISLSSHAYPREYHEEQSAAFNNYGAFLCRQGQYDVANTYFLKAIANPNYLNMALAYENAGLCAVAAHHTQQAMDYFEKALAHDPSLTRSSEQLAMLQHV